jgi:acyl-CoA thioester hydrolase
MVTTPVRPSRLGTIPAHCRTETLQRVGVAETDMMGIVHHANYAVYFERGRLEYMCRRGLSYKEVVERGYHMPVVELSIRYRKPARFDDVLCLETRLGALSRVTVRFDYSIRRPHADHEVAATEPPALLLDGHVLLACVDAGHRPRRLPEDIVSMLFLSEVSESDALLIPGSRADRAGTA